MVHTGMGISVLGIAPESNSALMISTCFERQTQPTMFTCTCQYVFWGVCDGLITDINVIHEMLSMQTTCTTCKHVLNLPQEVYHEKAFLSIHLSNVYVTSNTRFDASNYSNISVGSMFHDHISNLQTMCTSCKHLLMNSGRTCPKNYCEKVLSIHISNVMS